MVKATNGGHYEELKLAFRQPVMALKMGKGYQRSGKIGELLASTGIWGWVKLGEGSFRDFTVHFQMKMTWKVV